MLVTGDREESAKEVAQAVGITEVYSSVSARGKMELVEQCMSDTRGIVVVVGDGINDAPALAAAHVGIAMIGGAFGSLSPGQGAVAQELIDVVAILWALTTLFEPKVQS